jgi:signal transduction histidine kinase/ligand-binding sensor domain-containing protein
MSRQHIFILFTCLFLQNMIASAQVTTPFFKTYSKEFLGLSENGVMSVYEDPQGFMWFCTISGLKRWDGTHWKTIPVNPSNPKALPDARVSSIMMDNRGKYWIINRSGLMLYDPKKPLDSSITRLDTIHRKWKNLPDLSNMSKPVQLRKDAFGIIWAALPEMNGILQIDPVSFMFQFLTYSSEINGEKLNFYDVQMDVKNKSVWALSKNHGVVQINMNTGSGIHMEKPLLAALQQIWQEKDDILQRTQFWWSDRGFIWCLSKDKPFVHFYPETKQAQVFHLQGLENFPNDPTYEWERCLEDTKGNFWVTNFQKGVIFIEFDINKAHILKADISDAGSLAHNLTNKISMDSAGNIWIAHRKAGVSRFSYMYEGPHTLYPLKLAKEQHPDNYHIDVQFDKNSNENLTTYTGTYQKKYGTSDYISVPPISPVALSAEDEYVWTNENSKIQNLGTKSGRKGTLPKQLMYILENHSIGKYQSYGAKKGLWFIVPDEGLYVYSPGKRTIRLISDDKELFFDNKNKLIDILFDRKGRLWCHMTDGIALLMPDNSWKKWTHSGKSAVAAILPPIEHMTIDYLNRVWMISRNRIVSFDGKNFVLMDTLLPFPLVRKNSIYQYNQDIWIGNMAGALRYNPQNGSSKFYPVENGVYRIRLDSFGKIALLNLETISYIYPEKNQISVKKPGIFITDFKIFEDYHGHLLEQKRINLHHYQNFITFYFANKDYLQTEEYAYAYKMDGVDDHWVRPADNRKFATYSKLKPGLYTFTVRLYLDKDLQQFTEDSVTLKVHAAWYQTAEFQVFVFLGILGILAYLVKQSFDKKLLRQKAELEKKFAVENERSRIARDMHDDLGSGLSAINLLSNFLKNEKLDENSYKQIEKIASSSTELNQKLREIVWSMNPGHDYVQNLADFIRRYIADLKEVHKQIEFSFIIKDSLPDINIPKMIQKELFLCVKEVIYNAIKHSGSDTIKIFMSVKENTLILQISDSGPGFNVELAKRSGGNGILNITERMSSINGSVNFYQNNGCTVELIYHLPS